MHHPRVFDARQLRKLVEAAEGARGPQGDPYYLVNEDGKLSLVPGKPCDKDPPAGTVFEIDTLDRQPKRPRVTDVSITSGDTTFHLDHRYDAVFWSESAVEKFLFPYYASVSLWNAAYTLQMLTKLWYGYVPGAPTAGTGVNANDIPFALAHIPDSEYVGLIPPPGHDLHLLFMTEAGVKAHPLAGLIQAEEAQARETADRATRNPASPDGA